MTIFQIIILVFIAVVIYKAIKRFIKKEISLWLLVVWIGFWSGVCIIALFPVLIERAAHLTGIGRGVDLIIYLALLICFYILFKLIVKQQKLEKDFVALVRKVALDKAEKKK